MAHEAPQLKHLLVEALRLDDEAKRSGADEADTFAGAALRGDADAPRHETPAANTAAVRAAPVAFCA